MADDAGLQAWEISAEDIIIGDRIAVGGFAEVYIGKYEGTLVAVKLLMLDDEITMDRIMKEVMILARLRHPNLILFMGFCLEPRPALVTELMQRGSLFKVLQKQGRALDTKMARVIAIAVARGMAYLHGRRPPLLHLDLKSPNILVDDRWHVKVADFGLSQQRTETFASRAAGAGTPEWMAPEVMRSEPVTDKADVYSYGVVLWEVLTGAVPWESLHPMQIVGAVGFQGKKLDRPQHECTFLVDLCMRCMSHDPTERPRFSVLLKEMEAEFAPGRLSSLSTSLSEAAAQAGLKSGASSRRTRATKMS